MIYLRIGLEFPGMRHTSLCASMRQPMVDKVELVVGAKHWALVVETVSLGDVMGQG